MEDLATELGVTRNAVRAHLARLEHEGVIERAGLRRGVSRPAVIYQLTERAELLFSRAYAPVLTQLLHVLSRRVGSREFDRLLREVGARLMMDRPRPRGPLRARAESASALLNELGGVSRVESTAGRLLIRGYGCPLSAATLRHPEACNAVASLLASFAGAPVTKCCERDERLRCCFVIGGAGRRRLAG